MITRPRFTSWICGTTPTDPANLRVAHMTYQKGHRTHCGRMIPRDRCTVTLPMRDGTKLDTDHICQRCRPSAMMPTKPSVLHPDHAVDPITIPITDSAFMPGHDNADIARRFHTDPRAIDAMNESMPMPVNAMDTYDVDAPLYSVAGRVPLHIVDASTMPHPHLYMQPMSYITAGCTTLCRRPLTRWSSEPDMTETQTSNVITLPDTQTGRHAFTGINICPDCFHIAAHQNRIHHSDTTPITRTRRNRTPHNPRPPHNRPPHNHNDLQTRRSPPPSPRPHPPLDGPSRSH